MTIIKFSGVEKNKIEGVKNHKDKDNLKKITLSDAAFCNQILDHIFGYCRLI